MKKFLLSLASLAFLAPSLQAQEVQYPETISVLGEFNKYQVTAGDVIENLDEEEPEILGGLLTIPAGEFDLYLYNNDTYYFATSSTGGVSLSSSVFEGNYVVSNTAEGTHWTCAEWPGGTVDFNINLAKQTVTLYLMPKKTVPTNSNYEFYYDENIIRIIWPDAVQVIINNLEDCVITDFSNRIPLTRRVYNSATEGYTGNVIAINDDDEEIYGVDIYLDDMNLTEGVEYTLLLAEGALEITWDDWVTEGTNPDIFEDFTYSTEEDPYWYIQASFNGYKPNGEQKYALMDDVDNPGIYSGLFEVPEGEFKFNLISGQGMIFVPSTGGNEPYETTEYIEFKNNKFEGLLINAYPESEDNYWVCKNWDGGSIQVWVDANEGVIEVYAFPSSVTSGTIKGEISGPEDGLITINYECEWIERGTAAYEDGNAYLLEADGNKIELSYGYKENDPIYINGDYTLVIDLEYINLLPGTYTLVLAEGYLNVVYGDDYDDYDSAAVSYEFTYGTVGINNISSEEGEYNVIGINGAKVLNTKDPNKLRNLSNGVYIINGKKVMIRK